MKLIRCYIENFGGLQQYTVDFNEGLTVIHEPNGFGKTTLAEFIRAMFYGFPRGGKDLSKNLRQKYFPWQGGRYGGYLIFEHNDKRYRIDRSFGEAPKGDKFKLINEDTHNEVKDYGADIGLALFGLDSESFMRSTYMPQIRDDSSMTTDNIRAKLGNLLEDTGDMGSYEKAVQRLKDKRITYERYRGTGGSIHEAQVQITDLQQQIDTCTAKGPQLEELTEELTALRREQTLGEGALERIRKEISAATTAEAEAALSREYEKLCREQAETAQAMEALQSRYAKGLPDNEALTAAEKRMDRAAALEAHLRKTAADRTAEQTAALHRERFTEGVPTAEEFSAHRTAADRLVTAESERKAAELTDEEAAQLAQLDRQFAQGIPTEETLEDCKTQITRLTELQHSRKASDLPPEDLERMTELERFFIRGLPTEGFFRDCGEKLEKLAGLRHRRPALELPQEDKTRLEALDSFFTNGTPTQQDVHEADRKLNQADALRQENLRLSAAAPVTAAAPAEPQQKFHSLFFPALIVGLIAAAAGVFLLVTPLFDSHLIVGVICAAVGVIALIAAAMLQNNHSLMTKLQAQVPTGGISQEQRRRIEENEANAAALEAKVVGFLKAYPVQTDRSLRGGLNEVSTNLALYLPLLDRRDKLAKEAAENDREYKVWQDILTQRMKDYFFTVPALDEALQILDTKKRQLLELRDRDYKLRGQAEALDGQIAELTEALNKTLSPYFETILSFDHALQTLTRRIEQYRELSHKQEKLAARREESDKEIAALEARLTAFLLRFRMTDKEYRRALDTLRRDADSYIAAEKHLQQRTEALAARDKELADLREAHDAFCAAFALTVPMGDRQALKALERDAEAMTRLTHNLAHGDKALADFVAEHGHKPASELTPASYDLEGLKLGESELIRKQNDRSRDILAKEQKCRQLRSEIDRIPEFTDALTRVTEQKAADTESRRLLDSTVDFLQKARESLSASYLGGVQGHFAKYLNRLTGEDMGHIAVNTNLEVQLERAGSARPLVHFSAGQTDAVHLCMRLALSDALFEDRNCFMILDDPFVNLDEYHTAQALSLLQDLAKGRQIVYLVCNQSRAI